MVMETTNFLDVFKAIFAGPVGVAFSLTLLCALALGGLRRARRHAPDSKAGLSKLPAIPRELMLPVVQNDPDQVERAATVNRISHLVVQNDWDSVADEIAAWERRLDATPGGTRQHELAVETCLAGLRALIDEAPRTTLADLDPAVAEVQRFAARHKSAPRDPILATLAARAHLMVAASSRAEFWPDAERKQAWKMMAHHYLHAEAILSPFDPVAYMSPLLAGAFYELALGMPDGGARIRPAFEDWIDLDPSNPAIYAAHGPNLLGEDEGDVGEVLAEADRAAARTAETLGQGGYALCLLPVIDADETLRGRIDTSRLAAALMDLARLAGTQAEVNWAAATLADEAAIGGSERRAILQSAFDALVRRHLGVIYPRLWGRPLDEIRALLHDVFERDGTPSILLEDAAGQIPAAA